MQQRTITIVIAIIVVIAGISAFAVLQLQQPPKTPTTTAQPQPTTPTTQPAKTQTSTTTYKTGTVASPTPSGKTTETKTAITTKPTTTKPRECKPVTLTVLTRHPTEIIIKAKKAFLESEIAKKYCIEDLRVVSIHAGFWPEAIRRGSADVLWGGGPTLFDQLFQEGLLKPFETELALDAISQIPDIIAGAPAKRVKDGKIYWVAAAIASFGFTVNKKVAKDLGYDWTKLREWADLAGLDLAILQARTGVPVVGIADPTASTSNTRMYEIILEAYGWETGWTILTLMAANSKIYPGSSDVRDAVIRGEIMVGITIDFYGYTAQRMNPDCIYVLPQGLTIVNGDPIAVAATTKHPVEAEAFVAWVLTEGQKIWLDPEINRLPANPMVFDTPEGKKRADLYQAYQQALHTRSIPFNDTEVLMYERAMQYYFKATLVDVHPALQKAWVAIAKAYIEGRIDSATLRKLIEKLTELPEFDDPLTGGKARFTKDYAMAWTQHLETLSGAEKTKFIERSMSAWSKAAITKYNEVLQYLGQ